MVTTHQLYQRSEHYLQTLLKEKLPSESQYFLFGSRAKGIHGPFADINIGVQTSQLDPHLITNIQETIKESFVPFHVDIVDFNKVSQSFKREALKKIIPW